MLTLTETCPFDFKEEKKLGHMRCDFTSGKLANSWIVTNEEKMTQVSPTEKEELQQKVNDIMFRQIHSFDKLVEWCDDQEGYDYYKNLFSDEGTFNYWIRLLPVESEYSLYIHVYEK